MQIMLLEAMDTFLNSLSLFLFFPQGCAEPGGEPVGTPEEDHQCSPAAQNSPHPGPGGGLEPTYHLRASQEVTERCTIGAVVQGKARSGRRVAQKEQGDLREKSLFYFTCLLFTFSFSLPVSTSLPPLFSLTPPTLSHYCPSFTRKFHYPQ